jgi:UrcA family protein
VKSRDQYEARPQTRSAVLRFHGAVESSQRNLHRARGDAIMIKRNIAGRYRLTLATAAAFALAGLPAVHAADAAGTRAVTVRYDDLNLGTDSGVRTLYARLTRAAELVCPDSHDRDLARASIGRACQAQAVGAAVTRVQNPRLAALHARGALAG